MVFKSEQNKGSEGRTHEEVDPKINFLKIKIKWLEGLIPLHRDSLEKFKTMKPDSGGNVTYDDLKLLTANLEMLIKGEESSLAIIVEEKEKTEAELEQLAK